MLSFALPNRAQRRHPHHTSHAVSGAASVVARIAAKGLTDYLDKANAAHQRAEALSQSVTRTDSDGNAVTVWESPQQLRTWSHEQDIAQECYALANHCHQLRARALRRSYEHRQLCAVSTSQADSRIINTETLAQVAERHAVSVRTNHGDDPPALSVHRSPLATCAASNAPGVCCVSDAATVLHTTWRNSAHVIQRGTNTG